MPLAPWIALTDSRWFEYLSSRATDGRHDEVNFWAPKSLYPMKRMRPGEPMFFRLKAPINAVAGYGFFAHFAVLELEEAWRTFHDKNGDPDLASFLGRISGYRRLDLLDPRVERKPIGCTILRDAAFWPRERWLPWGERRGWKANIVRGKTETDPARIALLMDGIQRDSVTQPEEFTSIFEPLDVDQRELLLAPTRPRQGQGTFRTRLLDAYGRRCAITGERTEPVLEAAHVQPYLGPRSNHVQNGLLLTQEFHTLFDAGFITVTPDHVVRVSEALGERWSNGRRYYDYQGRRIALPTDRALQPSRAALEWHGSNKYMG